MPLAKGLKPGGINTRAIAVTIVRIHTTRRFGPLRRGRESAFQSEENE